MTDQNITTVVVAVAGFLTTVATSMAAYFMLRLKQRGDSAAVEAEHLRKSLNSVAVVVDATHKLTNSNMGIQLQLVASALRRVADLTRDPNDDKIALNAEARYKSHQASQAAVDSEYPKGVPDANIRRD